jgi:di/tricarboxylate transporter
LSSFSTFSLDFGGFACPMTMPMILPLSMSRLICATLAAPDSKRKYDALPVFSRR